jgi:transglutaminase-like putative cysteine protease
MSPALLRVVRTVAAGLTVIVLAPLTSGVFDETYSPTAVVLAAIAVVAVAVANPANRWVVRVAVQVVAVVAAVWACIRSVPGGGDLPADLVRSFTEGIDTVLSSRWPTPVSAPAVGAVAAIVAGAAAVAAELARSGRVRAGVLVPGVVVLLAIALLGAPSGVPAAIVLGLWMVVALVTMLALQASAEPRATETGGALPELAGIGVLLVAALVVPLLVTPSLAGADRYDPRAERAVESEVVETVSPLALVQSDRDREPPVELFRVSTDEFPRWRQVTLVRYDGRAWMPSAEFLPVGLELRESDEAVEVVIDVDNLQGSWVPLVDDVVSSSVPGSADPELSALLADEPLAPGRQLTIGVDPVETPDRPVSDYVAVSATNPFVEGVELPLSVLELATSATEGATNDYERALRLAELLKRGYRLDPTAPSGETLGQLVTFLTTTRTGNLEQFVAAYGLLAGAVGLPVRLAVGWEVPTGAGDVVTVSSEQTSAWPEVGFEDAGWIPFDPLPDTATPPPEQEGAVAPVAAPPAPIDDAPEQAAEDDDSTTDEADDRAATGGGGVGWSRSLLWVLVPLAGIAYLVGVPWWKRRRWRSVRRHGPPGRSVTGAFLRASDVVVDLGGEFRASRTDLDNGHAAAALVGEPGALLVGLADRSTRAVYAPEQPTPDDEQDAWRDLEHFEHQLRHSVGRRRWWQSQLSLRSLRRGAVSKPDPVIEAAVKKLSSR